jgi:hypothetical protein
LIGTTNAFAWVAGKYDGIFVENRALSAAEVLALYETAAPPATDYNNASNTSIVTGNDSTFASDTGFWAKGAGTTISAGVANFQAGGSTLSRLLPLAPGRKYRVTFTRTGTGVAYITDGANQIGTTRTANGTYTEEVTATVGTTGYISFIADGGTMDNILIYPLGLLLAPEGAAPGNGLVWNDASGNGAHMLLPSSVQWALPSNGPNRVRGTTSTSGNQALFPGASIPAGFQITRGRARARSGTPSVTLGTSSGASDLVSSVALSTSWQALTTWTGITAGSLTLWVNSTTSAVIEWDISIEPINY